MGQIVTLNGRPNDLDQQPSLKVGTRQDRTPIELNGRMVHGVNINGFDYPPCEPGCVLYLPGLPGYGSTIWDRSNQGNHGTITGATWVRLPSGLWVLSFDGSDDVVNCGSGASIDALLGNMTFIMWVNPVNAGEGGYGRIFELGSSNIWASMWNGEKARFYIYVGAAAKYAATANGAVPYGSWTFLACQFNSTNVRICTNSTWVNGNATAGPIDAHAADRLLIGDRTTSANCFNGKMALFRAFNTALSDTTIAGIFGNERHLFGV